MAKIMANLAAANQIMPLASFVCSLDDNAPGVSAREVAEEVFNDLNENLRQERDLETRRGILTAMARLRSIIKSAQ